jgi:hypothetical protein
MHEATSFWPVTWLTPLSEWLARRFVPIVEAVFPQSVRNAGQSGTDRAWKR